MFAIEHREQCMRKYINREQISEPHILNEDILIEKLEQKQREQSLLLEISNMVNAVKTRQDLWTVITQPLLELFGGKYYTVCLLNEDGQTHTPFLHSHENMIQTRTGQSPIILSQHPIQDGIFDKAIASDEPVIIDLNTAVRQSRPPVYIYRWFNAGIREMLLVKLSIANNVRGVLYFYGETPGTFLQEKFRLFKGIADILTAVISNILSAEMIEQQHKEITKYRQLLNKDKESRKDLSVPKHTFKSIVSSSARMQEILSMMEKVAPSDSTILLLGETGTGKEVFADAIHTASLRREQQMIKVNCAALPPHLIESELFGHEKGAFTGAIQQRIGKFERANNSTLFLDEIGELPLEFQAKLLRVLQEKEIERVGGKSTIKVNVRVIAATNRNLEEEVKAGRFRSDLFYRLNVVPFSLPPLRERKEDIPTLVNHFIKRYATLNNKRVNSISQKSMTALLNYGWPGNVRELEHLIERSVLLCKGRLLSNIEMSSNHKYKQADTEDTFKVVPLETMEREYILKVVKLCNGRIAGPKGAAAKLMIPSTTLNSRMQRLGITKDQCISSGSLARTGTT